MDGKGIRSKTKKDEEEAERKRKEREWRENERNIDKRQMVRGTPNGPSLPTAHGEKEIRPQDKYTIL